MSRGEKKEEVDRGGDGRRRRATREQTAGGTVRSPGNKHTNKRHMPQAAETFPLRTGGSSDGGWSAREVQSEQTSGSGEL